jgi:DNA-binding response OmpR family regulator
MPCIMVVEDEDELRDFLVEVLTDAGFTIVGTKTADAASQLLDQQEIRLVVTDINLPGRLDGIALANAARQRHPSIPCIFISGYPAKLLDAWALDDPAAFLQKPFSFAVLLTAVTGFLRTADAGEPPARVVA